MKHSLLLILAEPVPPVLSHKDLLSLPLHLLSSDSICVELGRSGLQSGHPVILLCVDLDLLIEHLLVELYDLVVEVLHHVKSVVEARGRRGAGEGAELWGVE